MVLIICLVLFIWALDGLCADYDHEAERRNDYRRAERRHKEMMEVMKNRKKVTRTVARDEHGRFVAQETVDYYDDDEEVQLHEGDVTVCEDCHSHSIANRTDQTVVVLACILTR